MTYRTDIPPEIINWVIEYKSNHNDGWTQKANREKLENLRDYIDKALTEKYENSNLCQG